MDAAVPPFQLMECARVFVNHGNCTSFVIRCNYCNDESSDWLEYVGHLHGDHHMPVETDEKLLANVKKCSDIASPSIDSSKVEMLLDFRYSDADSGGMMEEHLDLECSSAVGDTYDENYCEVPEDAPSEDSNMESDLEGRIAEETSTAIANKVKFSSVALNSRFFQLRTTPINIMMKFIDILRQNPLQWDYAHPDFSNKERRNKSSFQLSQQIKQHLNINITAEAAGCSAMALIRWFHREYKRFVECEVNDLQFVCYRNEYFEKLLQFLPLKQLQTFSCDECRRFFKSEYLLLSHKYKFHKGRAPFVCRYCDREFVHRSSLKLHENRHIKIELWPCMECGHQSSSKADYLKHLAGHSPEQPYKCEICGLAYKTSTNLSVHKKSHRQPEYECKICQKQFFEKYRYKRHLWQCHEDEVKSLVGDGSKSLNVFFNCPLCGRRFASRQTLLKHQVVHMLENYSLNGDETDLPPPPQKVKEELQLDYCDYCSLEFVNNKAYEAHMMLKHEIEIDIK